MDVISAENGQATSLLAVATETVKSLQGSVSAAIKGQDETVRRILATMIAGGHVLLEDAPGTGKTTLAKAIAKSVDAGVFRRVQFTPDLLPADITGVSVFSPATQTFHFEEGPVFADILLADEINRASPRTQSALLECMAEAQVTVDGVARPIDGMFFVLATQNPVEFRGTYPLPEAQMDRFALKTSLGYVAEDEELAILTAQGNGQPVDAIKPVVSLEAIEQARSAVDEVRVSEDVRRYIVQLVSATRDRAGVQLGASPRASIALLRISQAMTLLDGGECVLPATVQALAVDVIAHRLVLAADARYGGQSAASVVEEILAEIPAPQ